MTADTAAQRRWQKLASALLFATSVGVVSYLMITIVLALVAVTPLLWGWQSHLIVSGSMRPAIEPGWVAVAADYDGGEQLAPPAIVTFRDSEGGVVAHRVHDMVEADDGHMAYVTKGDANRIPDTTERPPSDVTGNVRMVVPFVGLPVLWMLEGDWAMAGGWLAMTAFAIVAATGPVGLTSAPGGRGRDTAVRRRLAEGGSS